jgi:hypothetical protein
MQWDEEAIELDRLAAELRVSQSPAVWCNVGCDESMDGRDPSGSQGMSHNVGVSVETVHMDIKPRAGLNEDEEPTDMFGGTEALRIQQSQRRQELSLYQPTCRNSRILVSS